MVYEGDWRRRMQIGDRIRYPKDDASLKHGTIAEIEYLDEIKVSIKFTNGDSNVIMLIDIEAPMDEES